MLGLRKIKPFKLLILDVDGVLTDGTKYYNSNGKVVGKAFNDKDWTAIKRFRALGISVIALSGDLYNKNIIQQRDLDFYFSKQNGILSKKEFIPVFIETYNVRTEEMAYVGDDYFDLDIAGRVGQNFCPSDAESDFAAFCAQTGKILSASGGKGVVAELFKEYKHTFGFLEDDMLIRLIDSRDK